MFQNAYNYITILKTNLETWKYEKCNTPNYTIVSKTIVKTRQQKKNVKILENGKNCVSNVLIY